MIAYAIFDKNKNVNLLKLIQQIGTNSCFYDYQLVDVRYETIYLAHNFCKFNPRNKREKCM